MNPYEVLGVSRSDDKDTIKQAYKKLIKKYHPDINPNSKKQFEDVQKAYEMIETDNIGFNYAKSNSNIDINGIFKDYHKNVNIKRTVTTSLTVSFADIDNGCNKVIRLNDKTIVIPLQAGMKLNKYTTVSFGDIDIRVYITAQQENFKVINDRLILEHRISAEDFLSLNSIEIVNHNNQKYKVSLKSGMSTTQLLKIPNAGVKSFKDNSLYVQIVVVK